MSHGQSRAWRDGSTALSTLCMGAAELAFSNSFRLDTTGLYGVDDTDIPGRRLRLRPALEQRLRRSGWHTFYLVSGRGAITASNKAAETVY
jgi:hypothetical protein